MKTTRIIYWVSTTLIFVFQGLMPLFFSQTEAAREGIQSLGYPVYFGLALTVCKVIGGFLLIIPAIPPRLKEWAYAGFTFDFLFASISHFAVEGVTFDAFMPWIVLAILAASYITWHQLRAAPR